MFNFTWESTLTGSHFNAGFFFLLLNNTACTSRKFVRSLPLALWQECWWHTVTVSACQQIERQLAEESQEDRDNGSFYFFTTHWSWRKQLACLPLAWTIGRLGRHVCITVLPRAIVILYPCFVISQCRSRYVSLTPWHWNDINIKGYKENSVTCKVFIGLINIVLRTQKFTSIQIKSSKLKSC